MSQFTLQICLIHKKRTNTAATFKADNVGLGWPEGRRCVSKYLTSTSTFEEMQSFIRNQIESYQPDIPYGRSSISRITACFSQKYSTGRDPSSVSERWNNGASVFNSNDDYVEALMNIAYLADTGQYAENSTTEPLQKVITKSQHVTIFSSGDVSAQTGGRQSTMFALPWRNTPMESSLRTNSTSSI